MKTSILMFVALAIPIPTQNNFVQDGFGMGELYETGMKIGFNEELSIDCNGTIKLHGKVIGKDGNVGEAVCTLVKGKIIHVPLEKEKN